jgi:lipid-binding SYLF domain-containing protein
MNVLESKKSLLLVVFVSFVFSISTLAQAGGWNPELLRDSKDALNKMIKEIPKLESFKNKAYGYVVFPTVTKVGIGIGGAAGTGVVFKSGTETGTAKLKQASIGLQLGGQQYSEAIFFENKKSFDHFINGNLKFDAQASAVAIKKGASIDASYVDGVAVFTRTKGGLMYEASLGGQHFSYKKKKN